MARKVKYPLSRIPATSLCYYNDAYYAAASDCGLLRPTDKDETVTERLIVAQWWDDLIKRIGQKIDYYVNTFDIELDDKITGEALFRSFHTPREMIMAVTLNNVAISVGMIGFVDDSNIEALITFTSYVAAFEGDDIYTTLKDDIEPKAGDVIHLKEFGNDRPGKREGLWFQITSRTDEDIATINQLGGHYVWKCKATRLMYSYEPGLPLAYRENIVSDNGNPGTGNIPPSSDDTPDKPYIEDINDDAANNIINPNADGVGDIFGGY